MKNFAVRVAHRRDSFLIASFYTILLLLVSPWDGLSYGQGPLEKDVSGFAVLTMSFNIHHGRGMDEVVDLERIARVIRDAAPDIVALQEVDNQTKRTGNVDQAAELGRLTGLHHRFAKQIDFEGGEYGQAILSKYPIDELQVHWLPGTPDRERRILGLATIAIPVREGHNSKIQFGTTHLHHANESFRDEQAAEIDRIVRSTALPTVIAGDFNALPDSKCISILEASWRVASPLHESAEAMQPYFTFPANAPDRQIDFVMATPIEVWPTAKMQVIPDDMASDHRPILATLVFAAQ